MLEKLHTKPSEAAFSTACPYYFRPEADNDVISGIAIDNVGIDAPLKCGDSSTCVILVRRSTFDIRANNGTPRLTSGKKTGGALQDTSGRWLFVLIMFLLPVELYRGAP